MAMMITRFHKLIQSRTVWAIILGLIVIAFVGFFTPTMQSGGGGKQPPAGELFGKEISRDEYRAAFQNTYIWYILRSGRMIPVSDELSQALREEAWIRLAALRKADRTGIKVTDQEVIGQLRMLPLFQAENGSFDPARYQGVLSSIGLKPAQVESVVREQIVIQKLMMRPALAALIPPEELERAYRLYTDRVVLEYAVLPREKAAAEVSVSRDEAQALFEQNPEAFRMPARVSVSYVEFPASNYLDRVELTGDEALAYYNSNIEQYRMENTGDVAVVEYQPFEEVETAIRTELKRRKAQQMAAADAADLVAAVAPRSADEKPDFTAAAEAAGLRIRTQPAFGPADPLQGIDETAPFRQAAFSLQDDMFSSFSDPVIGQQAVYVLSLNQRYPSFIPEFDVVEDEVTAAAREQAVEETLSERARTIRNAADEAVTYGRNFAETVRGFGLEVQTSPEFDLTTELDSPYANALISASLDVPQNDVCEPVPVEDGILIAYVAERISTDPEIGLPAMRAELTAALARSRSQRLIADWQTRLLQTADFVNQMERPTP